MAIIRRSELERHIKELEKRYKALRAAVGGSTPNQNVYEQYHNNPEQYAKEFIEVSVDDVMYALEDVKASLNVLKDIKKMQAPRIGRKG